MTPGPIAPVTLALLLAASAAFAVIGPASDTAAFQTFLQHLAGVLRHGDTGHLLINLVLLGVAGPTAEAHLGSLRFALFVLALAMIATLAEFVVAGPGFVGLSGVVYGVVSFALIAPRRQQMQTLVATGILAILAAEWAFLTPTVSVYAHIAGAMLGGALPMLNSLFGQKGVHLKPMEWAHVAQVLPIIAETDEDDAREAEEVFLRDGFENMYVLMDGRQLMGLTGYGIDETAHDIAWLSWTYLSGEHRGLGYGKTMVDDLLGMLAKQGVRKIFIETSDYEEDGKQIYHAAHRLYEDFGATLELTLPDYHAEGEAKLIYGLDNPEFPQMAKPEFGSNTGVALMGMHPAPEAENVAGLQWDEIPESLTGVDITLSNARERGFRMAVLALPQDLSDANSTALDKNFRRVGRLADYYGPDVGQDWWVAPLKDAT